jgi:hypothetical protein
VEEKCTDTAKGSQCIIIPEKIELSQIIIRPPDAPSEGINTKSLNLSWQQDLIKLISKSHFLVSCKQTIEQPLRFIAFISANYLDLAFSPLIFQHNTIHFFKIFITEIN